MSSNPWTAFRAFAQRVECRLDAWARTKMSEEEYADAVVLDKQIKRNFWKWGAYFLLAAAFMALLIVGIQPQLHFGRAFFYAALIQLYGLACVASAWYGYRKWSNRPAWKVVGIFIVLMLAGFVVGAYIASFTSGKPFYDLNWEKIAKGTSIAMLLGIGLATVLITIAHLRKREAVQKAARLQAEAERERLARQSMQAELKMLQAQVEPHFLFNTLANLRHLVQVKSPDALAMLDHLIHYLRTALPEIRAEASTLGREAELARAYLEILRLRMGGALEIAIHVPPELAHEPFPPLMLITLVENAVKHGVAPLGQGRIEVRASKVGGSLRVDVDDDGRGLHEPIGQGVGLANIRERLRALFGEAARLDLSGREPAGTRASIELPA